MKNILVVTGSPRKGGNSDLLADAFIKGALSVGSSVTRFDAAFKSLSPCKACNRCFSNGGACVFDNDFNELAMLMEKSDVIVFATPLYWFNFSAQIKAAIDKLYAFNCAGRKNGITASVLLATAETSDFDEYDALTRTYERIADYLKWEDMGKVLVNSVSKKGDILKTDALAKAEALGASI